LERRVFRVRSMKSCQDRVIGLQESKNLMNLPFEYAGRIASLLSSFFRNASDNRFRELDEESIIKLMIRLRRTVLSD
jgi:hypothetical protein